MHLTKHPENSIFGLGVDHIPAAHVWSFAMPDHLNQPLVDTLTAKAGVTFNTVHPRSKVPKPINEAKPDDHYVEIKL